LKEKYGPWALVTGAASGLGAGFADQIAAAGLNVVLVDVDEAGLNEQRDALARRHGVELRPVVLDLRREDLLDELLPRVADLEIGLLVNNAGIAKIGSFLPQERSFLLGQLAVNVRAVLLLSHAFGNAMRERGRGGIIMVSSGAAWAGAALNANYSATKAYGLVFAESLWDELAGYGIDVLGFMPTTTDTPMLWAESPKTPRSMVMSVESTVKLALDSLGKTPSIFAGTRNRVVHRILRSVLPRSTLIRLGSRALRSMSG
jgi:short-subunit dehydrogenase